MENNYAELGQFLENLRKTKQLSLRVVSQRSGLSHAYIRDLELSKNRSTNRFIRPSPKALEKLANAYNYPYEQLMILAGYINTPKENERPIDRIMPYLMDCVSFRINSMKLEFTFKSETIVTIKLNLMEFANFLEKIGDNFKKVDSGEYVNVLAEVAATV